MATPSGGRPTTGLPWTVQLAAAQLGEPGDAAQQRGLSAARRTDDAHDLVAAHREGQLMEGDHRSIEEELARRVGDNRGLSGRIR